MCTSHCKCYSKLGQKPKTIYDGYSSATLKKYGRDTKPLVWDVRRENGFDSMYDCYKNIPKIR